jgi:CHAT domain-containing protein
MNLGKIYWSLPTGSRAENGQRAIGCFQEALRFWTPEVTPREYALTQANLGAAYGELATGDPTANVARAVDSYQRALAVLTPEAAPADHRRTAGNLGDLYFGERRWEEAHRAYASAVAAADALYLAAATDVARQAELAEAPHLVPHAAYCLARLGRLEEAVVRLEAGRTRALAEALARDRAALTRAAVADRAAFEAARGRVRSLEAEGRGAAPDTAEAAGTGRAVGRPFASISADLRAARRALAEAAARISAYVPDFLPAALDFAAVGAAAADGPLVYLLVTTQGGLAMIVPPGVDALGAQHAVWLDGFRAQDLDRLLVERDGAGGVAGGYLVGQETGDETVLAAALERMLPRLRERLVGPLADRLRGLGFERATFVPTGRLALLPLHAAAPDPLVVAYAPSARALRAARDAAGERAGRAPVLLAVGDPRPSARPLAAARAEVAALARLFAPAARRVLRGRRATRAETLRRLAGATHLHFACHGDFHVAEPLDSALYLAAGRRLTLRDVLDGGLDLSAARLVVLSACRTGLTEQRRVPDEAVGLPAGLLQAGVPSVVGTLWPVDDRSTALLMGRFYQHHLRDGLDAAVALHRARLWLRAATARELDLARWYERRYEASGGRDRLALTAMRHYRATPDATPFQHPYYWAPFVLTGASPP